MGYNAYIHFANNDDKKIIKVYLNGLVIYDGEVIDNLYTLTLESKTDLRYVDITYKNETVGYSNFYSFNSYYNNNNIHFHIGEPIADDIVFLADFTKGSETCLCKSSVGNVFQLGHNSKLDYYFEIRKIDDEYCYLKVNYPSSDADGSSKFDNKLNIYDYYNGNVSLESEFSKVQSRYSDYQLTEVTAKFTNSIKEGLNDDAVINNAIFTWSDSDSSYTVSVIIKDGKYYLYLIDDYGLGDVYLREIPFEFNPYEWHTYSHAVWQNEKITDGFPTCNTFYIDGKRVGMIRFGGRNLNYFCSGVKLNIGYYSSPINLAYKSFVKRHRNVEYAPNYEILPFYEVQTPEVIPHCIITATSNSVYKGQSVTLDASKSFIDGGSIISYKWSTEETTPTITVTPTTNKYYECVVTADNGKDAIGYTYIQVINIEYDPVALITADKKTILIGETIELSGINSYCINSSIVSYLWSTGATTDTIEVTPEATTVYTLTVTAENGRSNITTLKINVETGEIELMKYLPQYWHENAEMKQIQKNTLNYLLYDLRDNSDVISTEAYIGTSNNDRLVEWEHDLCINSSGTIAERRENVLSFFKRKGKLNEEVIKLIVNNFADGAECRVEFIPSVIRVLIRPHSESETMFPKVQSILNAKKPAHLGLYVDRFYCTWGEVKDNFETWDSVKNKGFWNDVRLFLPD